MANVRLLFFVWLLIPGIPASAQYRVVQEGWNPFSRKSTGIEKGACIYRTQAEAEQAAREVKQIGGVAVRRVWVEACSVDNAPDLEVNVPKELQPEFPELDEDGDPKAEERKVGDTLKEYTEAIEKAYKNAREAKEYLVRNSDKLSEEAFAKANALVEIYNQGLSRAQNSRLGGSFNNYRPIPQITDADIALGRQQEILDDFQERRDKIMADLAKSLEKLTGDREQIDAEKARLEKEREELQAAKEMSADDFQQKLDAIMKEFDAVDRLLQSNPAESELGGIEARMQKAKNDLESHSQSKSESSRQFDQKEESWQSDYEVLEDKLKENDRATTQWKNRNKMFEDALARHKNTFTNLQQDFREKAEKRHSGPFTAEDQATHQRMERLFGTEIKK